LANSKYATVQERGGRLYLCIKTAERAHSPKHLWQRIRLSRDYAKALARIESELEHWPGLLQHKCKQRLTKMTQYLIRARRWASRKRERVVSVPTRAKRVDNIRERKAESAADLEATIERELLERLKSGAYGDIYNFAPAAFGGALDKSEVDDPARAALREGERGQREAEAAEAEGGGRTEYVEGSSSSSGEDESEWDEGESIERAKGVPGGPGAAPRRGDRRGDPRSRPARIVAPSSGTAPSGPSAAPAWRPRLRPPASLFSSPSLPPDRPRG